MVDMRGRWSWDVPGFEPPQPATTAAAAAPTAMPRAPPTAMVLRPSAGAPRAPPGDAVLVADRLEQLADSVQVRVSRLLGSDSVTADARGVSGVCSICSREPL